MTSDTLQWLIGIGLLVVFLLVMMRGCGGMGCGMGGMRGRDGCGMGRRRRADSCDRQGEGRPGRDHSGPTARASERGVGPDERPA